MIWVTPETEEAMRDVMRFTGLTRKALVQAMSNERKRYKAEGYTDEDLRMLGRNHGLAKQLNDVSEALKECISAGFLPLGLDRKLKDMMTLAVCTRMLSVR